VSGKAGRKRVVLHEDDVGMSHGANMAFIELSRLGTCSSGSVMVPCPWFPEAAEIAAGDPSLDVGVHLTLTSEQKPFRWRPLTAPPKSAGLTDELGYFWPDVPRARKAHPDAVEAEMRAQIEVAVAAGIDITHFDAHMGTAEMPEFTAIYRRLGQEYNVPVMLPKTLQGYNPAGYAGDLDPARFDAEIAKARAAGEPIFDAVLETPWTRTVEAAPAYRQMFAALPEGLSFLALHFNTPADFLMINPEDGPLRIEEYQLFTTPLIAEWIAEFGLEVIGMRALRDELRAR